MRDPNAPLAAYARIIRGDARLLAGRLDAADADFLEVMSTTRAAFGAVHAFLALGIRGHARVAAERGQADSAAPLLRDAIAAFGPAMRPNHHYLLSTKRSLAEVLAQRGRYAGADSILRDLIGLQRASLVKGHVEIGRALHALGPVQERRRDDAR